MYKLIFLVIFVSVFLPIFICQVHISEKNEILGYRVGDKAQLAAGTTTTAATTTEKINYDSIVSDGGTWTPAFVYRNNKEYEKYGNIKNKTMIKTKKDFEELVQTTRKLHDIIVFQVQCFSDTEFEYLKKLADNVTDERIIIVKSPDLSGANNPVYIIQNVTKTVNFTTKYNITEKHATLQYPYITLKRNELQIDTNKSKDYLQNHIDGFVGKYETTYETFMPLIYHYTWIRLHMHMWPKNLTMAIRKEHQKKHFEVIFKNFIKSHKKTGKQFIIYTSNTTFCHGGQIKKPTEVWTMKDTRWGATTIYCRTHNVLLQIADLSVLVPNEILVKPEGPRHCETTIYREHMVVVLRIDQYTPDVDLYFDIKLPSKADAYRTYVVERCYLQGRKSEGHEINRKLRVGHTYYNRHKRIVLKKACPRNGALVFGTVGLEYIPHDVDNEIRETFTNATAHRIVFLVEGGLQDYCRVKKVFDWMAFSKKICVMMILIALPLALLLVLILILIRLRFYIYRCVMCIKAASLELWQRSKPTAIKMKDMAKNSPNTLSNTFQTVKSSDVTYCCYKCLMLLHPKNIVSCCKASGRGMKRLCTPVGHLIGIGAYLLQRFVYNICVKIGGAPGGTGRSLSARLGRAREYTAQHIGNVTIYFIQGLVTISVVRAITLVAATLLEIT